MGDFLRAENVSCSRELRTDGASTVREISFAFEPGSISVLAGSEHCGKNLLLRLLGLLETPDEGEIFLHGAPTRALGEEARMELRNRNFGYVFAEPFLLNNLSVVENVAMPLFKISGVDMTQASEQVAATLDFIGLRELSETRVDSLSLPDQQCVSLARALVTRPEILLVENADTHFAGVKLLADVNQKFGTTIIMSAGTNWAEQSCRKIEISEGQVVL